MAKTATAPTSDLVTQRKHVAALESERAQLAARLRQASAESDSATVMQLTTRREMLPVLLADGRAALVPLEIAAVEEELDAVAARLIAQRVTVEEADRARETARAALRGGRAALRRATGQFPAAHDRARAPDPAAAGVAGAGRRPSMTAGPWAPHQHEEGTTMPTTPDPRLFHGPAVTFGTTTPPASTGRMTPARRRELLGHTAAGRAILAAEDARNGARAVTHA